MAKKFIESSIESGDWGVVRWLARVSIHVPDGLLREAYPIGSEHPDTIYKMNYLIQLSGRTEHGGDDAGRIVGVFRSKGRLSPEQIPSAEEWAKDTYRKLFYRHAQHRPDERSFILHGRVAAEVCVWSVTSAPAMRRSHPMKARWRRILRTAAR